MKKTSNVQRSTSNIEVRILRALESIGASHALVVDRKTGTLRMVDVDREKVYKIRLGKALRKGAA